MPAAAAAGSGYSLEAAVEEAAVAGSRHKAVVAAIAAVLHKAAVVRMAADRIAVVVVARRTSAVGSIAPGAAAHSTVDRSFRRSAKDAI